MFSNFLAIIKHINSLWPSDTIWRHESGSTLAQVMACCLTAPSHYLNQCWLIISGVQWHSCIIVQGQFHKRCLNHQSLKSIWKYLKIFSNFPGANQLRVTLTPVLHIGDKNSPVTQVCCRAVWHCDCSFNPVCLQLHRVTPRKKEK